MIPTSISHDGLIFGIFTGLAVTNLPPHNEIIHTILTHLFNCTKNIIILYLAYILLPFLLPAIRLRDFESRPNVSSYPSKGESEESQELIESLTSRNALLTSQNEQLLLWAQFQATMINHLAKSLHSRNNSFQELLRSSNSKDAEIERLVADLEQRTNEVKSIEKKLEIVKQDRRSLIKSHDQVVSTLMRDIAHYQKLYEHAINGKINKTCSWMLDYQQHTNRYREFLAGSFLRSYMTTSLLLWLSYW